MCCTQCGEYTCFLGTLGNLDHYRCPRCGWGDSAPHEDPDKDPDD